MSRRTIDQQTHELDTVAEDLALFGPNCWFAYCTCGWRSRPASSLGIGYGLWGRHARLAGRGLGKTRGGYPSDV